MNSNNGLTIWLAIITIIATLICPFISAWLQRRITTAIANAPAPINEPVKLRFDAKPIQVIDGLTLVIPLLLIGLGIASFWIVNPLVLRLILNFTFGSFDWMIALLVCRAAYALWLYHQARIDALEAKIDELTALRSTPAKPVRKTGKTDLRPS